jgi:hypothetical protein
MNTDELVNFLILYLQSRNCHQWEFVGYKQFKSLFTYITGIKDVDLLRTLFEKILKKGYFEKRRIGSKTDYRFIFSPPS